MIKSVYKAFAMLDFLAVRDIAAKGLALSELASEIGIPTNTARTLLKTMISCGYVAQTETGSYVLGEACERIAWAKQLGDQRLREKLLPILAKANRELGELVSLVALANGWRVLLGLLDSTRTVKVDSALMETYSPYVRTSPSGRVLVAYAEPAERAAVVKIHGYPGTEWDDVTDEAELNIACEELRQRGYVCLRVDESEVVTMAVPVLTPTGRLLASVGCCVPFYRCDNERSDEIITCLQEVAADIAKSWTRLGVMEMPVG